jgi:hypothetical protein
MKGILALRGKGFGTRFAGIGHGEECSFLVISSLSILYASFKIDKASSINTIIS